MAGISRLEGAAEEEIVGGGVVKKAFGCDGVAGIGHGGGEDGFDTSVATTAREGDGGGGEVCEGDAGEATEGSVAVVSSLDGGAADDAFVFDGDPHAAVWLAVVARLDEVDVGFGGGGVEAGGQKRPGD